VPGLGSARRLFGKSGPVQSIAVGGAIPIDIEHTSVDKCRKSARTSDRMDANGFLLVVESLQRFGEV